MASCHALRRPVSFCRIEKLPIFGKLGGRANLRVCE
jgi:hypothetical protein